METVNTHQRTLTCIIICSYKTVIYTGETIRNAMHFIHSCHRACATSTSIMTDRGAEGRS
jgi:pyrimidine operon attenuation protein/uracil phosphoribosyltransferase